MVFGIMSIRIIMRFRKRRPNNHYLWSYLRKWSTYSESSARGCIVHTCILGGRPSTEVFHDKFWQASRSFFSNAPRCIQVKNPNIPNDVSTWFEPSNTSDRVMIYQKKKEIFRLSELSYGILPFCPWLWSTFNASKCKPPTPSMMSSTWPFELAAYNRICPKCGQYHRSRKSHIVATQG